MSQPESPAPRSLREHALRAALSRVQAVVNGMWSMPHGDLEKALREALASASGDDAQDARLKDDELRPYARLLELLDEFGISETDTLKHTLEDHQRWEKAAQAAPPAQTAQEPE